MTVSTEVVTRDGGMAILKVTALIGDDDFETADTYNGYVVCIQHEFGSTTPDSDFDYEINDAHGIDLTNGHGEAIDGTATDWRSDKRLTFGPNDLNGGMPCNGKFTFIEGTNGFGTASSTMVTTLKIQLIPKD